MLGVVFNNEEQHFLDRWCPMSASAADY